MHSCFRENCFDYISGLELGNASWDTIPLINLHKQTLRIFEKTCKFYFFFSSENGNVVLAKFPDLLSA